jgi:hypothetical protein
LAVTIGQEAVTPTFGFDLGERYPSRHELRAGDVEEVVAAGAWRSRDVLDRTASPAVPMVESTVQRGTYYGSYTIQPGDSNRGADVTVRLTALEG